MNAKFKEPERVTLELKQAGDSELEDRNHFDVLCLLDEPNENLFCQTASIGKGPNLFPKCHTL